jgi:hypothetical protein
MLPRTDPAASLLRRGILGLGALSTLGIVVELGVERHWTQPLQIVAWVAVGGVAVAIALLMRHPSRARVRLAQALAVPVVASAALGIGAHVYANYDAAPLDQDYGDVWESLPEPTRWWLALTKTVGPSPPLAPGALAQAGLCVLLATVRHPALGKDGDPGTRAAGTEA